MDVVQVVHAPQAKELFGISLSGMMSAVKGILSGANTVPACSPQFRRGGRLHQKPASEAIPDLQLHFVIGKLVDHGRKTVFGHGYSCHVCLLRPLSRGSVKLASKDLAGRAAD